MGLFKNKALIILPIFLVIMCLIITFLYHADYYLPKFLFHPFTLEFVSGVLLYQISHKFGYKVLFISAIIALISAFFVIIKIDYLAGHMIVLHNIEKGFLRVSVWGLFALSIVSFFIAIDNLKLYSWGPYSALLGNSSFALYLIQPYCILIALEAKSHGLSANYTGAIYISAVIILGILVSKTIELPLMRLTKKQLKNKIYPKLFSK
jgi:peptidoglycan/LPS O-acetylase OafA/YrhL